jgi:DNA repair protein RadC
LRLHASLRLAGEGVWGVSTNLVKRLKVDTPLTRIQAAGFPSASPTDLFAIGICENPEDIDNAEIRAREFLRAAGRIHIVSEMSADHFSELSNSSPWDVQRFMCWIELGRRCGMAGSGDQPNISRAAEAANLLAYLRSEKREHVVLLILDSKNNLIKTSTIHIGTLTMSIVGPREVFREAVREGASSIIIAHNHPSGDPTPSEEDVAITKKLVEIGTMLDIPLLDHIIVGRPEYVSLKSAGFM